MDILFKSMIPSNKHDNATGLIQTAAMFDSEKGGLLLI
jgi:hypothetical protein